ncbi:sensor domain-containing diguanylate cyclase [Alteromonas flava]|uniref:sensor domain-containing diguanylate cyclase n=1 Tax=Alteromonas flava TaxID=2048003 RepID=UPI0013DC1D16|nr:diguanylate cyclase [Alteromonas flava]
MNDQTALTVGKYITYFQETDQRLSLNEATKRFEQGKGKVGTGSSISLGISVAPVWLKIVINNPEAKENEYRLSVETPWLDHIDAWIVQDGKAFQHIVGGDAVPFHERPMQYRFFAFETVLPEGTSVIYLRIETIGPMALPIRISEAELATQRDISTGYQYGFLYGLMIALALYNAIIYYNIRRKEFGLYAAYLIGFVINSLSYTGQLHTWFTPHWGAYFQDWLDIFLMITYSIAGLHFARVLLNTKTYAPRLDKLTVAVTVSIPAGMLLGALFNNLTMALILAFILNTSFVFLFVAIGFQAYKHKIKAAKLFLLCSLTAAACICISTGAVAGLVPYNDVTFKLIEVGMSFEAICLAFLLAQRFREAEIAKQLAQQYARVDSLTGVYNRRGFEQVTQKLWLQHVRQKHDVAVIIVDIDYFKKINDQYGHSAGDEVLRSVAEILQLGIRKSDLLTRWGGEEFLILLPETSQTQALKVAETLRSSIAAMQVLTEEASISLTASLGVSGTVQGKYGTAELTETNLEQMIHQADMALYAAKESGRDSVKSAEN